MPKLSQYELEREANIARNRALMEDLELSRGASNLGIAKPKPAAKPVQPAKRKRKETEELPRRQSARLRKSVVDPNETPAQRKKRLEKEEALRIKQEEARFEAEEKARTAKRPRHEDLVLHKLVEQDPEDISTLDTVFKSVVDESHPRRVGDFDAFEYDDDSDKREAREVAKLREKLQSLKVVARAKVNQNRIYSAAYHPEVSKDLIFFGDKHGELGIWDARAAPDEILDDDEDTEVGTREGGKYWRLQCHWPASSKSSITSIKFDPVNAHTVYTTSYDRTIRSLSFTTGVSQEVYASENDALINNVDLTPSGNEMWICDGAGGATHLDLRERHHKVRRYGLSDIKIGCISVNPSRPHFVLTASNNRTLKIWDIRKLRVLAGESLDATLSTAATSSPLRKRKADSAKRSIVEYSHDVVTKFDDSEEGVGLLRGDYAHDKSCSSAYWDPRGRQVVSTSYDNNIRLWNLDGPTLDSSDPFESFRPFSRLRHDCQTGRWVTILRAQWSPNPDAYPHFTIGNMKHSLDIFSGKGVPLVRLSDPSRISAVQAVTCSHPNIVERAVSGNASGRCVLWAPEDVGSS
ncbi:hypothetical protein AGABI2DRAFT_183171 [Agaricus bisporus var. bisporus H97]|uniref:hypothetical protein n=1 Tax=Agaricus bisporus var. bisporus (strain H97 / ATCC MYA-4626 / FGSC 10389) TaxID=936046 RepID=UPI00029F7CFA|nr:hypothetical protein AGABI2DRAFT_183171 [Agaricus bisporus var. bisporus H97]EKV50036.1 hypothetical protein AGABI2DRAFT_183171 [Agaricus bisporus var. bisporus H97]